jgi:cell fate (sporulation/competence/biofilm development) regulator YlbF (YheA/YmcA/DUF963 family)
MVVVVVARIFSTDKYRVRIEVRDEVNEDVKAVALFQSDHPLQRYSMSRQTLCYDKDCGKILTSSSQRFR